jgi:hypothetical protein
MDLNCNKANSEQENYIHISTARVIFSDLRLNPGNSSQKATCRKHQENNI